jgi:hypothetical protein
MKATAVLDSTGRFPNGFTPGFNLTGTHHG